MGIYFGITPAVCDVVRPKPFVATAEFAEREIVLPPGSEIRGKLDLSLFPHQREPMECFDDPNIRIIDLQWASRLGKTIFAQTCLAKMARHNPNPCAWGDADITSVERVLKRLWRILEKIPDLADVLPRVRNNKRIELAHMLIHGAWSGSPSAAADYAALVVVLNEIDKMSRKKSDEADFAELMRERAKGFARHKILRMSTPALKQNSRIEKGRLAGDNRRREVPCPRCNGFQELIFGETGKPGGLRWDKSATTGRSDPLIAYETAWYECVHCRRKIFDEHRKTMLNAGVWIPEGMHVVGSGKLKGKPLRPGPHASFGPLSTLHSLLPSITWGYIAKEWLGSYRDKQKRRNFVNSWLGLTWDEAPPELAAHELAARLCTGDPQRICPLWSIFLTRGVDVQGDRLKWIVAAWGPGGRGHVVDYGWSRDWDDLAELINGPKSYYAHADGGNPLRPAVTLIDSGDGNRTEDVYAFCKAHHGCWPCKGHSTSRFDEGFRLTRGEADTGNHKHKANLTGLVLVTVNTERTQRWVQRVLDGDLLTDDDPGFTLAADIANDPAFLAELQNEYATEETNQDGYQVHTWKKRGPNDLRDALRYARTAALYQTRDGRFWNSLPPRPKPGAQSLANAATDRPAVRMPDGRPFF